MSDQPNPPPPPDESDPAIRPRAVASRHFRKPSPALDAPGPGGDDPETVARNVRDEEELEQLAKQFKGLVGRKKAAPADRPADEEARIRRKPMPRSGVVHPSVQSGEGSDSATTDANPSGYDMKDTRPEPVALNLPPGFALLAWKLGGVALVMFGLGYILAWWMHQSPPFVEVVAAPPAPPPAVWRAPTSELLDRALAADRAGDRKGAIKLVRELAATEPELPGLGRYNAELEIREGNFIAAENILLALTNAGREVPQAIYLRALSAARQRHFEDAYKLLLSSLALDPLPADTYYQMAEILRRQGKLTDAMTLSNQALLRVRPGYGISRSTVALKSRLAQIEAGQVAEVDAALAEPLKTPPLSTEWMFTAAALGLQRGDRAAAAEWLGKARVIMPRDEFNEWVDDYFFRQYGTAPEMEAFRLTEDERRRRGATSWEFFIDP